MDLITPYFMKNKAWFYYEEKGIKTKSGDIIHIKLTEEGKKIPKVVKSYKQYLKDLEDAE